MIRIAFLANKVAMSSAQTECLLRLLPDAMKTRFERFHFQLDAQAFLLGKFLLLELLTRAKIAATLDNYQVDEFDRPFIPGVPDFNISHTKGMVVCALATEDEKIGIDIEQKLPVPISDFKRVFTPAEFDLINNSSHPLEAFYTFWTRKEAIMKADGRGFSLDPASFDARQNSILLTNQHWYYHLLPIIEGYTVHLACQQMNPKMDYSMADEWLTNFQFT